MYFIEFYYPLVKVFFFIALLRVSTSRERVLVPGVEFEKQEAVNDPMSRQRFIHWSRLMKQLGIRVCIEFETMSLAPSENIIRRLV